jgi:large conductance mechanosensitive channel
MPKGRVKRVIGEFRAFVLRGNVVDLAIAVAIGAAFTAVVTALTASFITPVVTLFAHKKGLEGLYFEVNGVRFQYGLLINALITFFITAAVIFFFVLKPTQALMVRFGSAPPSMIPKSPCPACLTDIPKAAVRCSACTQELGANWAPEEEAS